MKKLILLSLLAASLVEFAAFNSIGQSSFTGAPAPTTITVTVVANTPVIAVTGNVQVVSISAVVAANGTMNFYDCATLADPVKGTNFVTAPYTTRIAFPTNYVTSYVGYNGYTNYYTNTGVWYAVTNVPAMTNTLPTLGSFGVFANTVSQYSSPMLFAQGVSILSTVNGTVIVQYIPNR